MVRERIWKKYKDASKTSLSSSKTKDSMKGKKSSGTKTASKKSKGRGKPVKCASKSKK